MLTAVLGLLTAVFVLLTGFFAKKNDTATTKFDTTQEQVKVLASNNAELEAANASKDARIKQLEAQLAAQPSGEPSTSGSPATSDTPAVFHKGPLTLKPGVGADLDAAEDPQWRTDGTGITYRDLIFSNISPYLGASNVRASAMLTQQDPTFATCHDGTGYSSDENFTIVKLKKTKTLCVITSEGRYSVLRIKSASNQEVAFDVTTYAKDGD